MDEFVIKDNILKEYKGSDKVVVIPDGVTEIAMYAFCCCHGIIEIIIPDSVTRIKQRAFVGCDSLERLTIPASVKEIEYEAFRGCYLKSINISDLAVWCDGELKYGYSNINSRSFDLYLNGELVTDLVIPDSVTTIRHGAFMRCKSIKSVTIPSSVTSIEASAFCVCSSLVKVSISDSVKHIGANAFDYCQALTECNIPKALELIGSRAFNDCQALTKFDLPESLKEIGDDAFYNCNSIEEITINSYVKKIGYNILGKCTSLKKIYTDSVFIWRLLKKKVDTDADIEYYINGEPLTDSMIPEFFIENGELLEYTKNEESVIIPDNVTSIKYDAFSNNSSVKSITIPTSVKYIDSSLFSQCENLKNIYISCLISWCNIEFKYGGYSYRAPSKYNLYLNGELITDLVIPDSVSVIRKNAFRNCSSIKSLTVPDSVTSIEEYAFSDCENLKYINISDSVKSIDSSAFYYCPLITYYYVVENDCIIKKYASSLPLDIEKIYADARVRYTIIYHHSDWADDTGDSGMGYEYNNSYTAHREPKRTELLIKNGELYGFIVCGIDKPLLINGQTKTVYDGGHGSPRYGSGDSWTLEEDHCVAKYMRIPNIAADSEYKFSPKDFPAGLVSKIIKQVGDEDSYGDFNGRFAVTVELTEKAIQDPDGTLSAFSKLSNYCNLIKKL